LLVFRDNLPFEAEAVLATLPFMFVFAMFTLFVFTWMSLLKYSMSIPQNPFSKVRVPFMVVNIFNAAYVAVTIFMINPNTPDDLRVQLVQIGGVIMASISLILAIAVLFYGLSLYRFMQNVGGKRRVNNAAKMSGTNRMKYGAFGITFCLIGESVLWLITSIDIETFFSNELILGSVYYIFSVISMSIVLFLFRNGVTNVNPNQSTLSKQKSSSHINSERTRPIGRVNTGRSIAGPSEIVRSPSRDHALSEDNGVGTRSSDEDLQHVKFADPSRSDSVAIWHSVRERDALLALGTDIDHQSDEVDGVELATENATVSENTNNVTVSNGTASPESTLIRVQPVADPSLTTPLNP